MCLGVSCKKYVFGFIKKIIKNKIKIGRNIHCSEDKRNLIKILPNKGKTLKEISNLMDFSINMVCNAIKKKKYT